MLAIREDFKAYLVASDIRRKPIIVEANTLEVIRALNFECGELSESKVVMDDIVGLASRTGVLSFMKCPRMGNRIMHHLVRIATSFRPIDPLSSDAVDANEVCFELFPSSMPEESFFLVGKCFNFLDPLIN